MESKQRERHFGGAGADGFAISGEVERSGQYSIGMRQRDANCADRLGRGSTIGSGDPADSEGEICCSFLPSGVSHGIDDAFANGSIVS